MTVLKKRSQKILPNQLNNLVQYKLSAMINEEEAKKKEKKVNQTELANTWKNKFQNYCPLEDVCTAPGWMQ